MYFTYSLEINNILIFTRKSHCCNDSFTNARFTSLLTKNI